MASNKVETTILDGYAKTAEQLLNNHYPEDYTSADVVKLAEYLIDEDLNRAALVKKAALYDSAGRVLCVNMVNSNHEEALEELEKVAKGAYIGPVVSKLKDMIGAGKMSFGKATE
jgi:phosphoribosylamine-glycine ligase